MAAVDTAEHRTGSAAAGARKGARIHRGRAHWPLRLALAAALCLLACGEGAEGVDPDARAAAGTAAAEAAAPADAEAPAAEEAPAGAPEAPPPESSGPGTPPGPKTRGSGPQEAGGGDLTRVPDPDELDLHDPGQRERSR